MLEKWIRGLARARWLIVVLWIALTAVSVLTLPDLTQIAKQTETKFVPADAESTQANDLLNKISLDDKEKSNAIVVLHRAGGLQQADHQWLQDKVKELKGDKDALGILAVHSAYDDAQLADKFQSKDQTTELVEIGLPKDVNVTATQESVDQIRKRMTGVPQGADVNVTGSAPIIKDYTQTSQDGLAKTEVLTVVLVLVILLAVFRSPIAPLIPLITITMSFLFARGMVAVGTRFGLPISNFTETFLVATLFGAGTDYCILLIHRFREELSKGFDRVEALVNTVRTVGKTVVFSASTVLIAFFLIGFAKFGLYQSAVGVSIGMLMTLLAALTLAPSLMLILGPKLFWPFQVKKGQGHGESKFWGFLAGLVSRKPLAVLLITVLVLTPFTLLFKGERSFDDIAEINPNIGSVKGFRTVEKAFSSGEIMPITITLTSSNSMRTAEGLAALEKASAAATQVPGVAEVRSAARPLGKQLEDLTIPKELDKSTSALGDLQNGVGQVADGLGQAQSKVQAGVSGVAQLQSGLNSVTATQQKLAAGTTQLGQGTTQVASGLKQGATMLNDNLSQVSHMQQGLSMMAQQTLAGQQGVQQVKKSMSQMQQGVQQLDAGIGQAQGTAASMADDLNALLKAHPELAQDPTFQTLLQKQQGVTQGLSQTQQGFQPLSQGLTQMYGGLEKLDGGLGQVAGGQQQMAAGVLQLQTHLQQFAQGVLAGSDALSKVSAGANQVTDGLQQLAGGTSQMSSKIGDLQSGLGQMAGGLGSGKDALGKITDGLKQVKDAQQGIVDHGSKQVAGWYVPESAIDNADLKKALDTYISPDGKVAKFDVVLAINPYSQQAMNLVDTIKNALQQSLNGSAIQNPVLRATGTPATNHELDGISNHDFYRTGLLILLGIYIVLALMLRSAIAPLYLLASLLFSYLVTMGLLEFLFVKVFGQSGLSWTVSFFAFILLVALGVDYSIFLMARFKEEYRPGGVVAAMQKAMTTTGGVILSAAVIMGGTFGAMIFSGVNSMEQIGTAIVVGLLVYTTVVMGLIVPSLAILFGEANWWLLKRSKAKSDTGKATVSSSMQM